MLVGEVLATSAQSTARARRSFLWHLLMHAKNAELHEKISSTKYLKMQLYGISSIGCACMRKIFPKTREGQPGPPRRFQLQQIVRNMITEHTLPLCPGRVAPGCIRVHSSEILGK